MANIKATWKGQLLLGPIQIDVVTKAATGGDPRATGLQRLCACCEQPFSQLNECDAGKAPVSGAAIKRGDKNLTDVVYGVEADDGSYVVLDADVIEDIEESTVLPYMQIEEVVAPASAENPQGFPLSAARGSYFLAFDKDGDANAGYYFASLHAALRKSGNVAVTKWSQRGPQKLVGIHAVGDALLATVVPMGAGVRAPDERCIAHNAVKVSDNDTAATEAFLDGMTSASFDHDSYEDEAVPQREQAVEAALKAAKKGKKVKVKKASAKPAPQPTGSMAGLLAQTAKTAKRQSKGGSKKKAAAKK